MEHVTWLRLQEAARLLAADEQVVAEVAHQVGFESERAFRTAFHKAFGCSPSAYRSRSRTSHQSHHVISEGTGPERAGSRGGGLRGLGGRAYPGLDGVKGARTLDLAAVANARFSRGARPWFGDAPLLGLRPTLRRIHGVPFRILDEAAGPSFVLMRSRKMARDETGRALPVEVSIPIGRRVRWLFVLHACAWAALPVGLARYVFRRTGGAEAGIVVRALGTAHPEEPDGSEANIQDWYFGYEPQQWEDARAWNLPSSRDPAATPQYLYTLRWKNPDPGVPLERLVITSRPEVEATLGVLAVTVY